MSRPFSERWHCPLGETPFLVVKWQRAKHPEVQQASPVDVLGNSYHPQEDLVIRSDFFLDGRRFSQFAHVFFTWIACCKLDFDWIWLTTSHFLPVPQFRGFSRAGGEGSLEAKAPEILLPHPGRRFFLFQYSGVTSSDARHN